MACLRLFAFPDLPLFCVPFFVFLTAFLTSLFARAPYLAIVFLSNGSRKSSPNSGGSKCHTGPNKSRSTVRSLSATGRRYTMMAGGLPKLHEVFESHAFSYLSHFPVF